MVHCSQGFCQRSYLRWSDVRFLLICSGINYIKQGQRQEVLYYPSSCLTSYLPMAFPKHFAFFLSAPQAFLFLCYPSYELGYQKREFAAPFPVEVEQTETG